VLGSTKGIKLKELMKKGTVSSITHELAIVETRYILCRRIGRDKAWAKVENLLNSGYVMVEDASTIIMGIRALFATKESEILREMDKTPFETEIVFL